MRSLIILTALALPATALADVQRWTGSVRLPGGGALAFTLTLEGQGAQCKGAIDIPQQSVKGMPLRDVTCGPELKFTLAPPRAPESAWARFELKPAEEGRVRGSMVQHGHRFKVGLKRLDKTDSTPRRPQRPQAPLPYTERPAKLDGAQGASFEGTLSIPAGEGPHPAVVLVRSGSTRGRDGEIFGHPIAWVLADHLARHGIASLRVDERRAGDEKGAVGLTLEASADDVRAQLAWLSRQTGVDANRLGLLGHAEGASVAVIAARGAEQAVRFVVLLAPPGVPGSLYVTDQAERVFTAAGAEEKLVANVVTAHRQLVQLIAADAPEAEVRAALGELVDAQGRLPGAQLTPTLRARTIEDQLLLMRTRRFHSMLTHDPREPLRALKVPVLALWGRLDLQVSPSLHRAEVKRALAGNPDVRLKTFDGLNHLFQPAETGLPDEYGRIETTFSTKALSEISDWIRARAGLR